MKRRVIGYTSTTPAEIGYSGGSHGSQRQRIGAAADGCTWDVQWVSDSERTTATYTTPALAAALDELREGRRDALVVAGLGHLTRSARVLTALLDDAKRHGWALVSLSPGIDTATAEGQRDADAWLRLLQWQRESRSAQAAESLLAGASRGVRLGRPVATSPHVAARILAERESGMTLARIADGLTAEGIRGSQGADRWYPSSVASVLRSVADDSTPIDRISNHR